MPTPAVNGADSISQRTGGLRRPPSIDPRSTAPTSAPTLAPRLGLNPMSRMKRNAIRKVTPSSAARSTYGTPRPKAWATNPPATDPVSIATPVTTWARAKIDSSVPL